MAQQQKVRIKLAGTASSAQRPTTTQPAKSTPTAPARSANRTSDVRGRLGRLLFVAWSWAVFLWFIDHKIARLIDSLAALLALAISAFLWWVGASFTLLALTMLGLRTETLGYAQWLIPAGVSAIEVRWWPKSHDDFDEIKLVGFIVVVVLDAASSMYGFISWAKGRFFPIGPGFNMPDSGWVLVIPSIIISIVTTLVPERLSMWSFRELKRIWTIQYA